MRKKQILYSYKSVLYHYNKKYKKGEIIHSLLKDSYVIRLDGKGMTKSFKTGHEFQKEYYEAMKIVLEKLPHYFPYISFAYTTSDEISILPNFQKLNDDKWYKQRQEKLLTIISSYLSSLFNQNIKKEKPDLFAFDARLIRINNNDYINYFKSRQSFSFCSFFDFDESKENKKITNRKLSDLKKLLSKNYYKDYSYVCYGYNAFYLNSEWKVEIAKDIKEKLRNIIDNNPNNKQ